MTSGPVDEFKLSITKALKDQLLESFQQLSPAALDQEQVQRVEERPGVYELYLDGNRVYVGKASRSLRARLGRHLKKLSGRQTATLGQLEFIALYVDEDLDASAPEKLLIKHYRSSSSVPWNTNGFGNNDPGRRRDGSLVKANHFDAIFPINLDVDVGPYGTTRLDEVLKQLKNDLPYNLRFEMKTSRAPGDYRASNAPSVNGPITMQNMARIIIDALPEGWQLTAMPGYLILYSQTSEPQSAMKWWRKSDGTVVEERGPNLRDAPAEIEEEALDAEDAQNSQEA